LIRHYRHCRHYAIITPHIAIISHYAIDIDAIDIDIIDAIIALLLHYCYFLIIDIITLLLTLRHIIDTLLFSFIIDIIIDITPLH
jgi:hypothetical protein